MRAASSINRMTRSSTGLIDMTARCRMIEAALLPQHEVFGCLDPTAESWPPPPDDKKREDDGRDRDHDEIDHPGGFLSGSSYSERMYSTRACRLSSLSWSFHGGIAVPGTPSSKTFQTLSSVGCLR